MTQKRVASTAVFGAVGGLLLWSAPAHAVGDVQKITDFGSNPSGIGMYLYTPTNVTAKPAIVVNVHACHGKGTDVCGASGAFAQQADKWGFLVICPSAVSEDGCWDVHSTAVLTHDGGGDATGIISMVKWVIQNKNADANRVYVAGHSSGGMMTNVLLGSYPDVFKAGAAYAGVPFACFAQGTVDRLGWNADCAQGKVSLSAEKWGDLVRAAYPSFTGPRPRIQIWHGTKDDVVFFPNFNEAIKQWTNVFGLSQTPTTTEKDVPQATWIRTRYKDNAGLVQVEAIEETNQPHNLVVDAAEAIHFFGLDGAAQPGSGGAGGSAGSGGAGGTGGAAGSGGAGGKGGGSAGAAGTGGPAGSGGTGGSGGSAGASSSGGAAGSGGAGGKGGTAGSAGAGGKGGTAGSGAAGGKGGTAGSAGASASGGTAGTSSSGGAPGSAGAAGVGGQAGMSSAGGAKVDSSKSDGCSVASGRAGHASQPLWLLAALACAGFLRRGRANRTRPRP